MKITAKEAAKITSRANICLNEIFMRIKKAAMSGDNTLQFKIDSDKVNVESYVETLKSVDYNVEIENDVIEIDW